MKSALQLELQDLHGLPYIATIIWFVLLGVCLLAVVFYLLQKNYSSTKIEDEIAPSVKKINQKGFK
tara:strand:- start:280 stop:477 length:198 start_codon:yes stop_codon:yes gene_type:complete